MNEAEAIRQLKKGNIAGLETLVRAYQAQVVRAAWFPDGQYLISGSEDKTVRIWKKDGTLLQALTDYTAPVTALAWSPNCYTVATGSEDGLIRIWEIKE